MPQTPHLGIDFGGPVGTPVHATGNGVVEECSVGAGYGRRIIINHGFNYKTLYGHLEKINVTKGQRVKRGDIIGLLGGTGRSTGPHLHYEVRKNGVSVNPINFYFNDLSLEEFDAFVEAANNMEQGVN